MRKRFGYPKGAEAKWATDNGVLAVKLHSKTALTFLEREVDIDTPEFPVVTWRWKVESILQRNDERTTAGDDQSIRIFFVFEPDSSRQSSWFRLKRFLHLDRIHGHPMGGRFTEYQKRLTIMRKGRGAMSKLARTTSLILLALFLQGVVPTGGETKPPERGLDASLAWAHNTAVAPQDTDRADIEWFKKELRISPKYIEKKEGILGLSWAHFLTMVFLICTFLLALIAVVLRYRRTKELLTFMLEEEKKNESKG